MIDYICSMSQIVNDTRKGSIIETRINDLAFDGKSVGEVGGKIIFFDGGLPGEMVRAKIVKSKARYNFGRVIEIVEKSPDRIQAKCAHFGICGGCTWQDLRYDKQLYFKKKQILDCLKHIGKIDNIDLKPVVGSDEQFYYRNKMEFSFNVTENDGFVFGLHRRGYFDQIFDLQECWLESPLSNEIVVWFREFVRTNKIPVYDVYSHEGFVRFLAIREAKKTGQVMLNIVTVDDKIPNVDELCREACRRFPQVASIVQNINNSKSNIARGESERVLHGKGYIEEEILGFKFRIYANSFFQTNTLQTEKLYSLIYEILSPNKNDHLLDLYCGAGAIGICASKLVKDVVGVELEPSAIRAAKENAELNKLENVHFLAGSVQEILTDNTVLNNITCAIIDPPRAGLHPKALKRLIEIKFPKMVYVSCNPASFARDAALLVQAGYKIGCMTPVDMFPHTMHIELVAGFYL